MPTPAHLALAALLLAGPALAQPAATLNEPCEAKDPTTAEINSREGVRLAKDGRFGEAVALFRIATRLDPCAPEHPLLLARALARQGEAGEAQRHYEEVIARWPNRPEADKARDELAELLAKQKEAALPPAPPPDDPAKPADRLDAPARTAEAPPWRLAGLIAGATGVAALGAGVFFALDAQAADDDLQAAATEPDRAAYDDLVDRRDTSSTLAWALYGVGGALLVGGAIMFFVIDEDTPAVMSAAPTDGGAVLGLSGRF